MGFRGEALPSIASVSRLTLRTRARGALGGTEIRVNGGVTSGIREVGAPEGTRRGGRPLLQPARAAQVPEVGRAESAQVSRVVTQLALWYPEIGFSLVSAGRRVLQCPPASGIRERFLSDLRRAARPRGAAEAGRRLRGRRLRRRARRPGARARAPERLRQPAHRQGQDHRARDDGSLQVATIKERSPEVHLFIEIPPERDRRERAPHEGRSAVPRSVVRARGPAARDWRRARRGAGAWPAVPARRGEAVAPAEPSGAGLPGVFAGATFGTRWSSGRGVRRPGRGRRPRRPHGPAERGTWQTTPAERPDGGLVTPAQGQVDRQAAVDAVRPMMPLGQFRDTYIIAIDEEGIAIVDQHVAHERVLFEQIAERLASGRLPSQRLLQPLVLDLSPAQREALVGASRRSRSARLRDRGVRRRQRARFRRAVDRGHRRGRDGRARARRGPRGPRPRGERWRTRCVASPRRWRAMRPSRPTTL
jgi:DNA mismatch repair protein MutL